MLSKIKTLKENQNPSAYEVFGAWVLALATLFGSMHDTRSVRQPAFISQVKPVYVYVGSENQPVSRNDNENETVHMPTKFDVGLKINAVAGKK